MPDKVLFVDDDTNLLAGIRRQLNGQYSIFTAAAGAEGLRLLGEHSPFAVVVSDMRMPGLDGIQFLSQVEDLYPEAVRIMLTGYADLETAVNAINEGHIYRFLTKPCLPETMEKALTAAIKQYHLASAEKVLLEKTLVGSVRMLMEILSVVNRPAFGIAGRMRTLVVHIAGALKLEDIWQYELAAALSQIGWITFSPDLLAKVISQEPLNEFEQEQFSKHALVSRALLENIPRLERIAKMIEGQSKPKGDFNLHRIRDENDRIHLGSQLLRVAFDFDRLATGGLSHPEAYAQIESHKHSYVPEMVEALRHFAHANGQAHEKPVVLLRLEELREGMTLAEDVRDPRGKLEILTGQELTYPLITYLFSLNHSGANLNKVKVFENGGFK